MPVRKLTRGGSGELGGDAYAVSGGQPDPLGTGKDQARQESGFFLEEGVTVVVKGIGRDHAAVERGHAEQDEDAPEPEPARAAAPAQADSGAGRAARGHEPDDEPAGESRSAKAKESGGDQARGSRAPKPKESEQADTPRWNPFSADRLQRAAADVITELHAAKQELAKELEANLKQLKSVLQETQRIAKDMEAVLREAKAEPKKADLAARAEAKSQKQAKDAWDPPTLKKQADQQQQPENEDDWTDNGDDSDGQTKKSKQSWDPPEEAIQPYQH